MFRRTAIALLVLAVAVGGAVWGYQRFYGGRVPFLSDTCRAFANGGAVRLDPDQMGHAATITAVGIRRQMPERAVVVALATALQESKLRNLSGGDRDSIGLFQQRPSQGWGTPEQLNDPRYAAGEFYTHLLRISGWQDMRVTDAAQAVQHSGHPELYQQWADDADTLAKAFMGASTGAVTCRLRQQTARSGGEGVPQLVSELSQDMGKLSVTQRPSGQSPGMTVAVGGGSSSTLGWRAAHWFVAKSHEYGIRSVSYDGTVWTAESGKWSKGGKTPSSRVEVGIPKV
ncbi:MAG: hypothetical protein JWO79_304 [Actinomycetia bacterium]|nr:hypothetical protein [Actinomycetes bacterium]MDQ1658358.1 hypothetical protein [Cryptosporangiaceae bacterium]